MYIFAARVFCIGTMFVTLAFSQTQTPPPAKATPSASPSPSVVELAKTPDKIWNKTLQEAGSPAKRASVGGGLEILSDTMGVDFRPYVIGLKQAVQKHWEPLIPESAMPPQMKSGKAIIKFAVMRDGRLTNMKVEQSSGDVALDRAAYGALVYSSPLAKLPASFKGAYLLIRATFLYNPGKQQTNSKEQTIPGKQEPANSDKAKWDVPKGSGHL